MERVCREHRTPLTAEGRCLQCDAESYIAPMRERTRDMVTQAAREDEGRGEEDQCRAAATTSARQRMADLAAFLKPVPRGDRGR